MYVYCTSKNTGPSYGHDAVHVLYLGTSVAEAEKAVGSFDKYYREEKDFPKNFIEIYSAIPKDVVDWELIQYYAADGWWVSIVVFELKVEE